MNGDEKPTDPTLEAWALNRRTKIRIWAIRSVIVIVATYIFVLLGVAVWLVWVALAYVALTLALTFWLTRARD